MRFLLSLLVLATPLAGGGASSPSAPKKLAPLWSARPGADAGSTALAADQGVVVTVTWEGRVVALDGATGKLRWQRPGGGAPEDTFLAVVSGRAVLAGPGSPRVLTLDLGTGQEVAHLDLPAAPTSLVDCAGHRMVALTTREAGPDGPRLVALALDPVTGQVLWKAPARGSLVGSGGGWLAVEVPSGTGRLPRSVDALRCEDGREARVEPQGGRAFSDFFGAGGDTWLVRSFDFGFQRELLCAVRPRADASAWEPSWTCLEPARDLESGAHRLATALVRDGRLYVGLTHELAHNLDPSPDAWLHAWDLETANLLGRSPPSVASGPMVDLGTHLLTTFGATGASDQVGWVDPATLALTARLPVRTAPRLAVTDGERTYVATYDGQILAVKNPSPWTVPDRRVLSPQPALEAPPALPALSLVVERVLTVHPARASTSGNRTDGAVGALVFLGPDGSRVATGGNDDQVRVHTLSDGRETWRSGGLGKDVEALSTCVDREGRAFLQARIYGGRHSIWSVDPFQLFTTQQVGFGWMSGLASGCEGLVADRFDNRVYLLDLATGREMGSVAIPGRPDPRGYRVTPWGLALAGGESLVRVHLPSLEVQRLSGPPDPTLTQVWMVSDGRFLTESCVVGSCTVSLSEGGGEPARSVTFDTAGAVWVPDVPSVLSLSADGRHLFFVRDGIEPVVVRLQDGARAWLPAIPRTMSACPLGVFSPFDPTLLALTLTPAPHQVTLVRVGAENVP